MWNIRFLSASGTAGGKFISIPCWAKVEDCSVPHLPSHSRFCWYWEMIEFNLKCLTFATRVKCFKHARHSPGRFYDINETNMCGHFWTVWKTEKITFKALNEYLQQRSLPCVGSFKLVESYSTLFSKRARKHPYLHIIHPCRNKFSSFSFLMMSHRSCSLKVNTKEAFSCLSLQLFHSWVRYNIYFMSNGAWPQNTDRPNISIRISKYSIGFQERICS